LELKFRWSRGLRFTLVTSIKEVVMKAEGRFMDVAKTGYVVGILGVVGVFAVISAVLIAWPALAYLGSKLF
jgi:hypothetical protein